MAEIFTLRVLSFNLNEFSYIETRSNISFRVIYHHSPLWPASVVSRGRLVGPLILCVWYDWLRRESNPKLTLTSPPPGTTSICFDSVVVNCPNAPSHRDARVCCRVIIHAPLHRSARVCRRACYHVLPFVSGSPDTIMSLASLLA